MFQNGNDKEERIIILRDKAAREGIAISDEVIAYIAEKYSVPQALKGALINVSAYAARRNLPITIDLARHVLDGTRFAQGVDEPLSEIAPLDEPALESAFLDEPADVALLEEIAPVSVEPQPEAASRDPYAHLSTYEAPSFLQHVEPALSLEEDDAPASLFDATPAEDDAPASLLEVTPVEDESYESILADVSASSQKPAETAPLTDDGEVAEATPSKVWFVPIRTTRKKSLIDRVGMALTRAGLSSVIAEGDKVAIKVHVGERGNTAFVSPIYIREIVRLVKEAGGKPFITDASTLYSGMRDNAIDHVVCGIENGFSYATIGAPFIIADGLNGHDGISVPLKGTKHFEDVRIGSAAVEADAMIVVSHVKGHGESGFGAAFKNVGMGLGTKSAKQRMHSSVKPSVDPEHCTRCRRCIEWCPQKCINMGPNPEDKAFIRQEDCTGCGECVAACAFGAIEVHWENDSAEFQERIVEHTLGALANKSDKTLFVNFLTNITPECDCWRFSDAAIVPDIGVLVSRDIVAVDQASFDKVTEASGIKDTLGEGLDAGVDKFMEMHHIDAQISLAYGEELGMGSRSYTIQEIG